MNLRHFALILAGPLLLAGATAVFANDPGGGTNGVGANVTLTDNGSTVTLANGIVTATINKDSGKITSLLYRGFQTVQSGGNIYYTGRGGRTVIVAAQPAPKVIGEATLENNRGVFNASAAIAGKRLLIRSNKHLYCIGAP